MPKKSNLPEGMTMLSALVPEELRNKVKASVAMRGGNLQDAVTEALEEWLQNIHNEPQKKDGIPLEISPNSAQYNLSVPGSSPSDADLDLLAGILSSGHLSAIDAARAMLKVCAELVSLPNRDARAQSSGVADIAEPHGEEASLTATVKGLLRRSKNARKGRTKTAS